MSCYRAQAILMFHYWRTWPAFLTLARTRYFGNVYDVWARTSACKRCSALALYTHRAHAYAHTLAHTHRHYHISHARARVRLTSHLRVILVICAKDKSPIMHLWGRLLLFPQAPAKPSFIVESFIFHTAPTCRKNKHRNAQAVSRRNTHELAVCLFGFILSVCLSVCRSVGLSVCLSVGQKNVKNVKNCQKSVKTCQKSVKTCHIR